MTNLNNYLFSLFVLLLLVSCGGDAEVMTEHKSGKVNKEELLAKIDSLEKIHQVKGSSDPATVSMLISAYSEYRNNFKSDKITPSLFLKAGDLAMSLDKWERAANIYKNFFNDFKVHPQRDDVLFQLGFIYDFQLKDKNKAEQTYSHYLKTYPDSVHILQVQARMRDLYLTEEELLEKFKKQNNIK